MNKLSGPMVATLSGSAPKQAVVLLHGYGSDGQDLIGLAGYWRELLPDAIFLAPNAFEPCRDNPGGYQWFPIDLRRPEYRADGAARATPVIVEFLTDLWRQTGLGPGKTILGGFSQGAMMSLHTGLSLVQPLLGVISFSGALIAPPALLDGTGARPPVCLVHGDRDPVVAPEFSAEAFRTLGERGVPVRYHIEPGAGHTIAEDGLSFASAFIAEISGAAWLAGQTS
jgi:phospholipase/carboxylesterase